VLPTTRWIPGFSACSGQHAWHSCRAGCIIISENPQGLATHMILLNYRCCIELSLPTAIFRVFKLVLFEFLRLISETGLRNCFKYHITVFSVDYSDIYIWA